MMNRTRSGSLDVDQGFAVFMHLALHDHVKSGFVVDARAG